MSTAATWPANFRRALILGYLVIREPIRSERSTFAGPEFSGAPDQQRRDVSFSNLYPMSKQFPGIDDEIWLLPPVGEKGEGSIPWVDIRVTFISVRPARGLQPLGGQSSVNQFYVHLSVGQEGVGEPR